MKDIWSTDDGIYCGFEVMEQIEEPTLCQLDEFLRLNLTRVLHRILTHPKSIS